MPPTKRKLAEYMESYSPPGFFLQTVNRIVHYDFVQPFVYFVFWLVFTCIVSPLLGLIFLPLHLAYSVLMAVSNAFTGIPNDQELGVVITGCDTGFGNLLAIALAERYGDNLTIFATVVTNKGFDDLSAKVRKIEGGHSIVVVPLDVTDNESVKNCAEIVNDWVKEDPSVRSLHAVVNNAGVGTGGEVDWLQMKNFEFDMGVNYFGMVRVTKAFLPLLKEQEEERRGKKASIEPRIINVTSMAGLTCGPTLASYSASKHAAEAFSSTLRYELSNWGIQVITVNPSFHKTPLVGGIANGVDKVVKSMPKKQQRQYGENYFDKTIKQAIQASSTAEWDADNVTTALIKAVVQAHPRSQMLIGLDAKFGIPLIRHSPVWIQDFTFKFGAKFGKGKPSALLNKTNEKND